MASSSSSSPFSLLPSPPASVGGGGGTSAAVDAIIAEAMDLCALEHIAALNTAHLPRDAALLPSHLESRFRALKSFPAANNGAPPPLHRTRSAAAPTTSPIEPKTPTSAGKDPALVAAKGGPNPDSPSGLAPPPPIAPRSSRRGGVSPSPSPPRRHTSMCCFAFSPKKSVAASPRSGGGGKGAGDLGIGDWEGNERIVAELKEQRRKLKKALQEQAKARSEAAKMVRLAKQASAKMSTFAIDDDDDDDDGELLYLMECLLSEQSAEPLAAHGGSTVESEWIVCLSACQRIHEHFLLVIVRKLVLLRIAMAYCIRRLPYLSREQLLIERQKSLVTPLKAEQMKAPKITQP